MCCYRKIIKNDVVVGYSINCYYPEVDYFSINEIAIEHFMLFNHLCQFCATVLSSLLHK